MVLCSSLFVSSTLSDPDVTEMLNCVSLLLLHQMAEDPPNPDLPAPAYDFSEDDSAAIPHGLPELDDISSFLKKTFRVAKWSPECHIMALVFVNRLTGYTNIRLHNANWRPILLCSLLLAQKVRCTAGCLSFGPIDKIFLFSVTLACARRPGAASQAFERMHNTLSHRVKT
jgi:hypothetical protein